MLPYKHYGAEEIEETIQSLEVGTPIRFLESTAEESTIRRWSKEYGALLPELAGKLEALFQFLSCKKIPLLEYLSKPFERLKKAFFLLVEPSSGEPVLSRASFLAKSHPLCL
jgi:hypothetical protein